MTKLKSIIVLVFCINSINAFSQIDPIIVSVPGSSKQLEISSEKLTIVQKDLKKISSNIRGNDIPSWSEIKTLATNYDLFVYRELNSQLRYTDGDIGFWDGERFPKRHIEKMFRAMNEVIQGAEEQGILIPTKGDLTSIAERVLTEIKSYEMNKE